MFILAQYINSVYEVNTILISYNGRVLIAHVLSKLPMIIGVTVKDGYHGDVNDFCVLSSLYKELNCLPVVNDNVIYGFSDEVYFYPTNIAIYEFGRVSNVKLSCNFKRSDTLTEFGNDLKFVKLLMKALSACKTKPSIRAVKCLETNECGCEYCAFVQLTCLNNQCTFDDEIVASERVFKKFSYLLHLNININDVSLTEQEINAYTINTCNGSIQTSTPTSLTHTRNPKRTRTSMRRYDRLKQKQH